MKAITVSDRIGKGIFTAEYVKHLELIAKSNSNILITGETGAGKGVLAQMIAHLSHRKKILQVNCGAMTETLLETTLFGHKKGAFTDAKTDKIGHFQEADGGTLFLDEITETTLNLQTKLLKVLDDGHIRIVGDDKDTKVNVRMIFATNRDIEKEIKNDNFRQDLFYRISVHTLHMSPLRERTSEISELVIYFMKKFSDQMQKSVTHISPECLQVFMNHQWAGNIRELSNVIERAVGLTIDNEIHLDHLPSSILSADTKSIKAIANDFNQIENNIVISSMACLNCGVINKLSELDYTLARDAFDKIYFENLLKKTGGNIAKASKLCKINRKTLDTRLNKLNINKATFRKKE